MQTAFFGEPALKAAVLKRLRLHRSLDEFKQGTYFEEGRGCHLGCMTHNDQSPHLATRRLFGIPLRVAHWLESVFEGLPKRRCKWWAIESIVAIPVGADLSRVHHTFLVWLLGDSGLLTINGDNHAAIEQCRGLHEAAAAGKRVTTDQWKVAEAAALAVSGWAAVPSARLVIRALESAAAAYEAARSRNVEAASGAMWEAARWKTAAGKYRAWELIAEKSLEIFAAAPVVGRSGECEPCVAASLAHLKRSPVVVVER